MRIYLRYIFIIIFLAVAFFIRVKLQKPAQTLPRNQEITFAATLAREPKLTDKGQTLFVADAKIYTQLFPRYKVGDRLQISGEVDKQGRIFYPQITKVGARRGVSGFLSKIRQKITANFAQILPSREASLVGGMVLGVDSIGAEFRDELINTGTIHVVVVSGQNLVIVAGLFLSLSKYLGRRLSLLLAATAVFGYALLTGFEPPVIRASLMVLFSSIAIYFGRERIALWSLVLAALVILFFNPDALFEVSFQLTFAATLGIITLGSLMQNLARKRFKISSIAFDSIVQNASISTSAYLFTAPVILFHFERISPVAPVVNVLVAELVSPIMILGFIAAAASLIFMPLAQAVAYFAYVPAYIFALIVSLFG